MAEGIEVLQCSMRPACPADLKIVECNTNSQPNLDGTLSRFKVLSLATYQKTVFDFVAYKLKKRTPDIKKFSKYTYTLRNIITI